MKMDFLHISLSDMKRILSFILLLTLVLTFSSCAKDENVNADTENTKSEAGEKLSPESVTLDSLLTFTHSEGEYKAPVESLFSADADGGMGASLITGDSRMYEDVTAPFGIRAGDSLDELCSKYSIQTGYGLYVLKGGKYTPLDTEKLPDFSKGKTGAVYVAYVEGEGGEWFFLDSKTVEGILRDKVMIQGDSSKFSVVLFAFSFNSENKIEHITHLYGNIKTVTEFINQ